MNRLVSFTRERTMILRVGTTYYTGLAAERRATPAERAEYARQVACDAQSLPLYDDATDTYYYLGERDLLASDVEIDLARAGWSESEIAMILESSRGIARIKRFLNA